MNIVIFLFFLKIGIVLTDGVLNLNNHNLNYNLNRLGLRYVIFKKKTLLKIVKRVVNNFDIYYNKSIVSVSEGINNYNDLSESERTLIETIISLCY